MSLFTHPQVVPKMSKWTTIDYHIMHSKLVNSPTEQFGFTNYVSSIVLNNKEMCTRLKQL